LKRKQSLTSKVLLLARVKESLRQIAVEKDTLMNNKSSLNLTQVLKDFQDKVSPLFNLEDLENFNGITLKDLEQKLCEEALILVGECLKIFLTHLTSLPEVHQVAQEKTQGWWRNKTVPNGCVNRSITTLGNVQIKLKIPYLVERDSTQRFKNRPKNLPHQGFCPLLRWLALEEGVTPYVWATVAKYGTISHSFETAQKTLSDWGINLSLKRIERLTYQFGQIALSQRNQEIDSYLYEEMASGDALKGKNVVISVDGGRTKIRNSLGKSPNPKTNYFPYNTEWIEPKLLTIYTVDETGKKLKKGELSIVNDGTFGNFQDLLNLLEMYLFKMGMYQAKQVLFIADGCEWIWLHVPPLLKKLGCPTQTYFLWDFYHVCEHISQFSNWAFSQEKEQKTWFKKARRLLKDGSISLLLDEMKQILTLATDSQQENLIKPINYLTKGWQNGWLNYSLISQKHLPIGSGAVESLIRQVVNLRLKGNGKFWLRHHAEILLHARCQWVANAWTKFENLVLTARIHPFIA
jgi:hypothetical protein